jgi:hypothetical protein
MVTASNSWFHTFSIKFVLNMPSSPSDSRQDRVVILYLQTVATSYLYVTFIT